MAAIVINVMMESANPEKIMRFRRINKVDFSFALITFLLVLFFDLLPAMVGGIIISIGYMVFRVSFPGRAELGRVEETGDYEAISWIYGRRNAIAHSSATPVPGVIIYRFDSPLIFSNAEAFKSTAKELLIKYGEKGDLPNAIVIDCEGVFYADTTGAAAVSDLFAYVQRYDIDLLLARVHSATYQVLQVTGVLDEIGEERIYKTVRTAVDAAVSSTVTHSNEKPTRSSLNST